MLRVYAKITSHFRANPKISSTGCPRVFYLAFRGIITLGVERTGREKSNGCGGKKIPSEEVVISTGSEVLKREKLAA